MSRHANPALYAFRYATQGSRTAADCLIEAEADDRDFGFDYFFWLIAGPSPIVIDCGFDERTSTAAGRKLLHHPSALLQRVGLSPADVKTVVLTHLHYDHAGCLDLFPAATFILQAAEMAHCTGAAMGYGPLRKHYRKEHVQSIVDASFAGRVSHIDGDARIAPGVTLHHVPGHTPGQQVVRVGDNDQAILFASDALHLNVNLHRRTPFPIFTELEQSCAAFEKLLHLAERPDRIVAGHDPHPATPHTADPRCTDILRIDVT